MATSQQSSTVPTRPTYDTQPVEDYTVDFSLGQDAYNWPDRIAKNAYAKGVNVKSDRGILSPRAAFERQESIFDDDEFFPTATGRQISTQQIFRSCRFQAFVPYFQGDDYVFLIVVAGLIYRWDPKTGKIVLLSSTLTLNQYSMRVNWSLAGRYIVFFDWPNYPLIVEKTTVFRANPNNIINGVLQPQVPISTIGAFNQDRLAVANAGNEFTLGDPVGNKLTPEAPITFTEVLSNVATYPGQSFSLGTSNTNQPITAMGFIQTIDSNTGLGPMFVATEKAVYDYHTDVPRMNWDDQTGSFVFGSLFLYNAGIVGPRAFVNVNADLIFLSGDGNVHAFSSSRNDIKKWGNAPVSREVKNWMKYWDKSLAQYAFLQYSDNRIYVAANPYRVPVSTRDLNGVYVNDIVHGGMVTINLNGLSTLQTPDTPPIWDGLWTGIRPMDMGLSSKDAYVIGKNSLNENHIWKVRNDISYDLIKGKERYINSQFETREYFGDSRFVNKYEQSITMPIQNVEGQLNVEISRKPSQASGFKLWKVWSFFAPITQCLGVKYFNGLAAHRFKELVFGAPASSTDEECNEGGIFYRNFRKLQLRVKLSARNWQIEEIKVKAILNPNEDLDNTCEQDPEDVTEIPLQCDDYWSIKMEEDVCNPQ